MCSGDDSSVLKNKFKKAHALRHVLAWKTKLNITVLLLLSVVQNFNDRVTLLKGTSQMYM